MNELELLQSTFVSDKTDILTPCVRFLHLISQPASDSGQKQKAHFLLNPPQSQQTLLTLWILSSLISGNSGHDECRGCRDVLPRALSVPSYWGCCLHTAFMNCLRVVFPKNTLLPQGELHLLTIPGGVKAPPLTLAQGNSDGSSQHQSSP